MRDSYSLVLSDTRAIMGMQGPDEIAEFASAKTPSPPLLRLL
jgi:hypothetical protein